MGVIHPTAALRNSDFRYFFVADVLRRLGSSMTPVALAFAVLHIDNSAESLSYVLAAYMAAQVAFVLIGGLVADRFPRTLVLQGSFLMNAGAQGAVAALLLSGHATIWAILVIEAVRGAMGAFAMPASQGLIPLLVSRVDLQPANALMAFARRGTTILGPAIAGVLVAAANPGWAFLVDAAGFAIGALALTRVHLLDDALDHEKRAISEYTGYNTLIYRSASRRVDGSSITHLALDDHRDVWRHERHPCGCLGRPRGRRWSGGAPSRRRRWFGTRGCQWPCAQHSAGGNVSGRWLVCRLRGAVGCCGRRWR